MDAICIIIINCLSFLLLSILVFFWLRVRKKVPSPALFDLVGFFMTVKVLLYFILPALLRGYSDWARDRIVGAEPEEIVTVYGIEFVSVCTWLVAILFTVYVASVCKTRLCTIAGTGDRPTSPDFYEKADCSSNRLHRSDHWSVAKPFMSSICALYLLNFPYSFKDVVALAAGEGALIQPLVMLCGPVIGIYLFSAGRRCVGGLTYGLGLASMILGVVSGFAFGSRGQVMSAALWMLFLFIVLKRKILFYSAIAGVIMIFLFHNVMTVIRYEKDFGKMSLIEKTAVMFTAFESKGEENRLLDSLEFRFGEASRMSVGFLRLADENELAGFYPIISALYAPLPRRFFPDKPEPGSVDGSRDGMGMYIIHRVMEGNGNMSEFFTGVHAYWELGITGVLILSALSGSIIGLATMAFHRFGPAGLPMMMIMLKPPWLEPKLWIAEAVSHVVHFILPLVLWWMVLSLMFGVAGFLRKVVVSRLASADNEFIDKNRDGVCVK